MQILVWLVLFQQSMLPQSPSVNLGFVPAVSSLPNVNQLRLLKKKKKRIADTKKKSRRNSSRLSTPLIYEKL